MKRIAYEDLPLLPSIIASTVCGREYKGQEFSLGMLHPDDVAKYEALRQKMTPKQIDAFADYVDERCKYAYDNKVSWFMKIVRAKGNAGRDQLYVWVTHWMTSWLKSHIKRNPRGISQ
jgi:hypothetical protein